MNRLYPIAHSFSFGCVLFIPLCLFAVTLQSHTPHPPERSCILMCHHLSLLYFPLFLLKAFSLSYFQLPKTQFRVMLCIKAAFCCSTGPSAWLCYCPINPEQLSEEQQQGSPAGLEHKKPSHILNKVESEPCAGRLAGQMQAEPCR